VLTGPDGRPAAATGPGGGSGGSGGATVRLTTTDEEWSVAPSPPPPPPPLIPPLIHTRTAALMPTPAPGRFPVKRVLLRPCIKLTKQVRDVAVREVAVPLDCLVLDRVLLYLEANALGRPGPGLARRPHPRPQHADRFMTATVARSVARDSSPPPP
jgi:hypothetical protein